MVIPLAIVAIIVLSFVLWVAALVDVARRQFREPNAKLIWVLVIVFAHGVGALVYFAVGRKQGALPGQVAAV